MSGIKERKKKRTRRKKNRVVFRMTCILIFLCIILGILIAVKGLPFQSEIRKEKASKEETAKKPEIDTSGVEVKNLSITTKDKKKSSKGTITLTVSSMGDCTLGTDANFNQSTSLNAYYNARGADYFFQNVRPILEKDDLSIVNFEGTLTDSTTRADKKFAFKADPAYAKILSGSSVEAANIANNHSKDYGEKSYTDTLEHLANENIAVFGYEKVQVVEVKGVKVGLTGIYELAEHLGKQEQIKQNIAALKEAGAQIIIVNFHWGIEKQYVPNDTQKKLAHLAIDEGADLVIGHHPHVLQGVEKYNGKYIAYSLGNFCFGGNSNPSDKDTMIFQQTFTIKDGELQTDDNINIIPCSLSSSSGHNDYCPKPLEGSEKERVLQKIEKYSNEIK